MLSGRQFSDSDFGKPLNSLAGHDPDGNISAAGELSFIHFENYNFLLWSNMMACPVLNATIHPDIKRTLVAMSERTGLSISQVTDDVLYAGLVEMQELPKL